MKVSCKYCMGIHDRNYICPKKPVKNAKRKREYRKDAEIYWSKAWQETREEIREYQNNIDLFAYYVGDSVVQVECVHHIILLNGDYDLAFDADNLIGLSYNSHKCIHELYKLDMDKVIEILRECKRRYEKGIRIEDKGILRGMITESLEDMFNIYMRVKK